MVIDILQHCMDRTALPVMLFVKSFDVTFVNRLRLNFQRNPF